MSSGLPPQKTLKNGRYELLRVLGEGSQGSTYEARDASRDPSAVEKPRPEALLQNWHRYVDRARAGESGRTRADTVAIKAFVVTKAKAWKDVELAEREAKTLASLDHPNLPRYIEHFEENGVLYLVMEKIEGGSLAELRRGAKLGESDIVRMVEDIAGALHYLHGRAPLIVHRDVKPGNILRRPDGSYALVDFGSVRDRLKPAGGSTVVGTFGYMAPEQFQGRAAPQSDVYGLGVTAITMLTGCEPEDLPHRGLGIDVARALPKGTSRGLVAMLTAMVEPDPDRRVGSVDEALAILRSGEQRRNREQGTGNRERGNRERQQRREQERERRRPRPVARGPVVAEHLRVFAQLGLFIAWLAVWLSVGIAVPLFLRLLSIFFGQGLRRAADACVHASERSKAALGRASVRVSGGDSESHPFRVRVEDHSVRVASGVPESPKEEMEDDMPEERRRALRD